MNGRHLDKIAGRLVRVRDWLAEPVPRRVRIWLNQADTGYRRAASIGSTPGWQRTVRAAELRRLIEQDLPDLIQTVREHNSRGQQGNCRYCGQPLRLILGPKAGLYSMFTTDGGVLCQDPNCPSSPDGHHRDGKD